MFSSMCLPIGSPPLRGGWRQRLLAGAPEPARPVSKQALGDLQCWADGELSARQLATHCHNALDDGEVTHPMIKRLASISVGQHSTRGVAEHLLNALGGSGRWRKYC